jgi:membrane-associated phospholipid phosphatase
MSLSFLLADRTERAGWLLIAAVAIVSLASLPFGGFGLAPLPLLVTGLGAGGLIGLAAFYTHARPEPGIATALVHVAQMALFTAFGSILSYGLASLGLPMWDETLHSLDLALGLDWRAYLDAVNARPWLGKLFFLAYISLIPQMVVLILMLSLTGRLQAVRTMMLAAIISGIVTIVMSGLMPAMAMYVHLGLKPEDFPNLAPAAAYVHVADMMALRAGAFAVLDIGEAQGIVTFPSYHAALGLILLAAAWSHPWLRWPFLVLNLLLIAATPIDGGHYFVDVAAGLAIAAAALVVARRTAAAVRQPWPAPRDHEPVMPGAVSTGSH